MTSWRVAKALVKLRDQINAKYPRRSKVSDGSIGNAEHASRTSDHNAWIRGADGVGVVSAIDITNDPAHGLSSEALAQALVASRDPRLKYVISNRRICSSVEKPWQWRPYSGANPHNHHVHISVLDKPAIYDDAKQWRLGDVEAPAPAPATTEKPRAYVLLKLGSRGVAVKELQRLLGVEQDGKFGPETEAAVRSVQGAAKIVVDGYVGPYTWDFLRNASSEIA